MIVISKIKLKQKAKETLDDLIIVFTELFKFIWKVLETNFNLLHDFILVLSEINIIIYIFLILVIIALILFAVSFIFSVGLFVIEIINHWKEVLITIIVLFIYLFYWAHSKK